MLFLPDYVSCERKGMVDERARDETLVCMTKRGKDFQLQNAVMDLILLL